MDYTISVISIFDLPGTSGITWVVKNYRPNRMSARNWTWTV